MAKYALGVRTEFSASHYLMGGDFGAEAEPHAHDYRLEVVLEGERLDEKGFLVDIVRVKSELGRIVERYRGQMLNDFPELEGVNPGLEAFSRIVAESLGMALDLDGLSSLSVKIWESENAWAAYRLELEGAGPDLNSPG